MWRDVALFVPAKLQTFQPIRYQTESTSSSIDGAVSNKLAPSNPAGQPLRASTSNGRPKNAQNSSSNQTAPVFSINNPVSTPQRSTTPRRGLSSQGSRRRLFTRSRSLPPTAVPVDSEMMPHILEEFDLSPKTTKTTLPGVENENDASIGSNLQPESIRPPDSELNMDLLNPQDVNRPDSETLTNAEHQSTPRISDDDEPNGVANLEKQIPAPGAQSNFVEKKKPEAVDALGKVESLTREIKVDLETEPLPDVDNTPASVHSLEITPQDEKENESAQNPNEIDQIFASRNEKPLPKQVNGKTSVANTVSEATVVLGENSDHNNLVQNGHQREQDLNGTKSTILPNMADDVTTIPDDVSEGPTLTTANQSANSTMVNANDETHNESIAANDSDNHDSSNVFENWNYLNTQTAGGSRRGGILKRNPSTSSSVPTMDANVSIQEPENENNLADPSANAEPENLDTELFQPENVNRNDGGLNTSQLPNDGTLGTVGTDSIAMGYLADAQSESDAAKPPGGRKRKSVRFFEIIEDDPNRPIELRDFAIPINNKMPPRIKTVSVESKPEVFEELRGHGPYHDAARFAYIRTKLEDEEFRDSLMTPKGQRVLPGPDSSAMLSSLMIEKPEWTNATQNVEKPQPDQNGSTVKEKREQPWVDSFSKKEVKEIEEQFSGKDLVSFESGETGNSVSKLTLNLFINI